MTKFIEDKNMKTQLMIELSDKTKKQIVDQLADFRKLYPQFQWERIENYNILIHSFGEFANKKSTIEKIETALYDKNLFYLYSLEERLLADLRNSKLVDTR